MKRTWGVIIYGYIKIAFSIWGCISIHGESGLFIGLVYGYDT